MRTPCLFDNRYDLIFFHAENRRDVFCKRSDVRDHLRRYADVIKIRLYGKRFSRTVYDRAAFHDGCTRSDFGDGREREADIAQRDIGGGDKNKNGNDYDPPRMKKIVHLLIILPTTFLTETKP